MSVFEGVIREEIERLESNIFSYKKMLEKLPKGSIFIRKNYHSYFVYRRHREKDKIISDYLGPLESLNAQVDIVVFALHDWCSAFVADAFFLLRRHEGDVI